VNAQFSRRYFGLGRSISVSHRMARSHWSFSDSRDSNETPGGTGLSYAAEYSRLFAELAAQVPDPVQRDLQVRAILDAPGGFITRTASVSVRRQASVALQGLRGSLVLSAFHSSSERLDRTSTVVDDLSFGPVRQSGYSASVSYRLTPTSSTGITYSARRTASTGTQPGNDLKSLSASFSTQLADRVTFNLSLRHTSFDSPTQPYTENGGQATIGMRF
jgi:uncharacterized protein (PEP-CTERM system associated)